jgi:hypothetical protein
MNYIELFGISASGKTYFKKRMISSLKSRRKKVFDQKEIIIQFYLRNFDNNFLNYFRSYLALFFYSKSASTVKSFFQRKREVKKKNNKIYFNSSKKKWHHEIVDYVGIDNMYSEILNLLEKKLNIKKNYDLYKIILQEIYNMKQDNIFKSRLKKWFLENIILIDILKKNQNINCVIDEGIVHKIFIMFNLKKNNRQFIKKIIKHLDNYGDLYLIKTNLKNIQIRSLKRKKNFDGFIYENYEQIVKEYKNLVIFKKLIKNKISYKKILN